MRQLWSRLAALLCLVTLPVTARLVAQAVAVVGTPPAWARVAYLSGGSVYLDVGTLHGVREGTPMEVVRGSVVTAHLLARYVSSNHTACTISDSTSAPVVGDSVRYQPIHAAGPNVASSPAATGPSWAQRRSARLRGRVGVRYLVIKEANGSSLTQPAVDLRLDGRQISGTGLGLAVDVRAQRTALSGAASGTLSPAGLARVYQAAMTYQPRGTRAQWEIGRQYASALSPIGIFDGAALDLNFEHWSTGVLAGAQPDAATLAPSGDITEYGVWLQRHNGPSSHTPWTATVGAIGSYDRGQINREFVYLRGTYTSRHFSLYAAEEVDANREWKRAVEGSPITPTSTFATAQIDLNAVTVSAGIDSRRTVRLYRDFVNPEIVFDDAFRQGSWGDVSLRVSPRLRLGVDARLSNGAAEGSAQAVTASLLANRLTRLKLGVRARTTRYSGPGSAGMLTSVALDAAPTAALRLSLNAGERTSAVPGSGQPATRLTWTGADLDLALGRSVYFLLSTYREAGTPTASIQTYAAVSWRF